MNENIIITVCEGSGCKSLNSEKIVDEFNRIINEENLTIKVEKTGCHGFCQAGPIVSILPNKIFYVHVKPQDCYDIIQAIKNHTQVNRLLFKEDHDGIKKERISENEIDFYKYQNRLLLKRCGIIDPYNIDEYLNTQGMKGLKNALEMNPEEVIDVVKSSGLRGRGGAGFNTGLKWSFLYNAKNDIKYLICNADEGDPGSFMDRTLMEGDVFSLIEGMTIAAYAVGAVKGFIYCRAEYPESIQVLNFAINEAKNKNFLGDNILNKGFNFDIEVKIGAGAFVCGEETALMTSIEGNRGMPKPKPPFPAQSGLWNKPTNINNVKTYAYVSHILNYGSDWFKSFGTEESPGTAVLSLSGKIKNSGIVEVNMGTSLRDIIYKIGGGIKNNKKIKAILTGGPSGGCLPEDCLDLGVDYESLTNAGSIMGSGGVMVLDENDSMIEVADYFLDFTISESCGKCTPCREGLTRMREIIKKIKDGVADKNDLLFLEDLANIIKDSAACGLGQTAPNPVLTTLRYFRNEYEELLKPDFKYYYITNNCVGCGLCKKNCPVNAIEGDTGKIHFINDDKCIGCGQCYNNCPKNAIIYNKNNIIKNNKVLPKDN